MVLGLVFLLMVVFAWVCYRVARHDKHFYATPYQGYGKHGQVVNAELSQPNWGWPKGLPKHPPAKKPRRKNVL